MTATAATFSRPRAESRLHTLALATLLPFAIAALVYGLFWYVTQPEITGDEPHYIVLAYSIAQDGDVNLTNNYANKDYQLFGYGGEMRPHAFDYGDGVLYTWHGLGLSALLAPVMVVFGASITAVRIELVLLSALLAQQTYGLIRDFGVRDPRIVWPVWAVTMFSVPLLGYSSQAFSELPASLMLVAGVRFLLHGDDLRRNLLPALVCAVLAPWFNARYLVVMGGLGLGIAARLYQRWRREDWDRQSIKRDIVPLAAVTVVGLGVMGAFNWIIYGSPSPNAMLHPPPELNDSGLGTPYTFPHLYLYGLGLLMHPVGGWLPFAPAHWLGFAGASVFAMKHKLMFVWGGIVLVLLLIAGSPYSPGWCPPARYIVAFVPLIAVPLALLLQRVPFARLPFAVLAVMCAIMSLGAAREFSALYPWTERQPAIHLVSTLEPIWPMTYFLPEIASGFSVAAKDLPRVTGEVERTRPNDREPLEEVVHLDPARDSQGHMAFGPYVSVQPGEYIASFTIAADSSAVQPIAYIEIVASEVTIASRALPPTFSREAGYRIIDVPFVLDEAAALQTRIQYMDNAEIWFSRVDVARTAGPEAASTNRGRFPDWQKMLAWGGVTLAAMAGFAFVARRNPET